MLLVTTRWIMSSHQDPAGRHTVVTLGLWWLWLYFRDDRPVDTHTQIISIYYCHQSGSPSADWRKCHSSKSLSTTQHTHTVIHSFLSLSLSHYSLFTINYLYLFLMSISLLSQSSYHIYPAAHSSNFISAPDYCMFFLRGYAADAPPPSSSPYPLSVYHVECVPDALLYQLSPSGSMMGAIPAVQIQKQQNIHWPSAAIPATTINSISVQRHIQSSYSHSSQRYSNSSHKKKHNDADSKPNHHSYYASISSSNKNSTPFHPYKRSRVFNKSEVEAAELITSLSREFFNTSTSSKDTQTSIKDEATIEHNNSTKKTTGIKTFSKSPLSMDPPSFSLDRLRTLTPQNAALQRLSLSTHHRSQAAPLPSYY